MCPTQTCQMFDPSEEGGIRRGNPSVLDHTQDQSMSGLRSSMVLYESSGGRKQPSASTNRWPDKGMEEKVEEGQKRVLGNKQEATPSVPSTTTCASGRNVLMKAQPHAHLYDKTQTGQ